MICREMLGFVGKCWGLYGNVRFCREMLGFVGKC